MMMATWSAWATLREIGRVPDRPCGEIASVHDARRASCSGGPLDQREQDIGEHEVADAVGGECGPDALRREGAFGNYWES
jgi:hypothetical protein